MWTLEEAIALCRDIESVAPTYGCHVALTGGVLYKDGSRKDLDLVFYRIRQVEKVDVAGLFNALSALGIARPLEDLIRNPDPVERWCIKASRGIQQIDCFFPEIAQGDYPPKDVELPRFDIGEF